MCDLCCRDSGCLDAVCFSGRHPGVPGKIVYQNTHAVRMRTVMPHVCQLQKVLGWERQGSMLRRAIYWATAVTAGLFCYVLKLTS